MAGRGASIYGAIPSLLFAGLLLHLSTSSSLALPPDTTRPSSASASAAATQINSNSILVALLDSHYTELAELVEKALLLQTLEEAVGRHNITIFAPRNEALERDLDPEFKRFLLEPRNLRSLQTLLMSHILPARIDSHSWPLFASRHPTLSAAHRLHLSVDDSSKAVDRAMLLHPYALTRPD